MAERKDVGFEARRQQIIDGALEVFASKGFEKATNKEIALASGIKSPGLIYHYFQDKSHLYREVLQQRVPLLQLLAHPGELQELPPQDALLQFGRAYLKLLDMPQAITFVRLILSDSIRHPAVAELFWKAGPGRAFAFLAQYMEQAMAAGQLRRIDPDLAVLQFMGPLVAYVVSCSVFANSPAAALAPEEVLQHNVGCFMHAMDPQGSERPEPEHRRRASAPG
jgi:AcrR family transcriptional regulator